MRQFFFKNARELIEGVVRETGQCRSVLVQAGHFLVYYDNTEDQLLPCIASELTSPRHAVVAETYGHFPLLTWRLGLDLLSALPAARKQIMVLVNDWQYVPSRKQKRAFYSRHATLPPAYQRLLDQADPAINVLASDDVLPDARTGVFFSEKYLRNLYTRQVKGARRATCPALDLAHCAQEAGACAHPQPQKDAQPTNKPPDCADEVFALHKILETQGVDSFINLYPLVCREYVLCGTTRYYNKTDITAHTTCNIGLASQNVVHMSGLYRGGEMVIQSNGKEPVKV